MKNFDLRETQQKICGTLAYHIQGNVVQVDDGIHSFFKPEIVASTTTNTTQMKKSPLIGNETVLVTA